MPDSIVDTSDPLELGQVAPSFDSCLVYTVHAYDGKSGKELSNFVINGMVWTRVERPRRLDRRGARIAFDDSLGSHQRSRAVVVGCGNLLRADDAVRPTLIRHLWESGVRDDVTLVDGGISGTDVWSLAHGHPDDITVFLIEAGSAEPGAPSPGRWLVPSDVVGAMIREMWDQAVDRGTVRIATDVAFQEAAAPTFEELAADVDAAIEALADGAPADRALAQPDFGTNGENRWDSVGPDTLCWPYGLSLHGGRIAIADSGNNRIMIWELG